MALHFITGNQGKFLEAKSILGNIVQIDLDLEEIQSIDPQEIIESKLQEAIKQKSGEFFIEDTSLYLDCMNGLPGPLIKWFLKTIGVEGLVRIVKCYGNNKAVAKCVIGYINGNDIQYFEGEIKGEIVPSKGMRGFGWDFIFKPDGYNKTFAEMTMDEKNEISMRKIALMKLKVYLDNKK